MKNIALTQEEILLLIKLLKERTSILESQTNESEDSLEERGRNASLKIKISAAESILKKLEDAFNDN